MSAPTSPTTKNWHTHRDLLFGFIQRRVSDRTAAEDLTQDVLVKAYSQRRKLKAPEKLQAWLFQIARNAIVDHYRAHQPLDQLPEDLAEHPAAENTAHTQLAECLIPFIEQLPPAYAQALTMADLQGLPQNQVAQHLGLSLSGAKSRIQRARNMLRQSYLECCQFEFDPRGNIVDYNRHPRCKNC